jgi:thiamine biosynthesis lipoprotein
MAAAKKGRIQKIAILALVLSISLLCSCSRNRQSVYRKAKPVMDTIVTITVVADSGRDAERAIEDAFVVIERFGGRINFFSDKSELSLINRNAGIKEVKVSPETFDVIEKALYVSKKTDGAFDPTIGPEIGLWDFARKIKPSDAEVRRKMPFVNYKEVVIDKTRSTVFLGKKGMLMDLGAIAKGYAADLAVATLKRDGIGAGIVANAGDIRTFGLKPDGKPWTVGIRNPRQKDGSDEIFAEIKLSDKAISTSGDYERYFIENGQRFHHILDPKTGYPARLCRSVSIITDKGVFTDSFSTAIFVLGPEKGLKLAGELGMEAIIIDSAGVLRTTPGLKGMLKIEKGH